ncbi:predicted protein [Histoplasma capsulatum var. duboisii H88]|uniref:Predicted protein n=1 Tax=Ajellomyces capsulatus (strain H88) TaxID=544711 RepID=F0UI36_AJEC8|nr:predicted protein [Histoplasma capsulatum var. duboisii H88]
MPANVALDVRTKICILLALPRMARTAMVLFAGQTMRTYELTHICLSLVDRITERRKKPAHHQIQIRLHVVVRGGGGGGEAEIPEWMVVMSDVHLFYRLFPASPDDIVGKL